MRLEKNIKNIFFVFIQYGINIVCSFLVRKALLTAIGINGVGLNSLFTEILTMLSLAEMGVGTAITYNLYKPLMDKNQQKISQLMWLFKKAYLLIAGVIFVIGISLMPVIHMVVDNTDYEIGYLRSIYFLFLLQTVMSYLFAYKRSLLIADQKNYILSSIDIVFRLIITVVTISILLISKQFEVYLLSLIALNFVNNLMVSNKVNSIYPYLKKSEKLSKEEQKRIFVNIKNIFIGKVSGSITNSTDNILISIFAGISVVGLYANYALVLNAVKQILIQIQTALQGSIGNLYAEGNNSHSEIVLKRLTFIHFYLASVFSSAFYNASTSFIQFVFGPQYIMGEVVILVCTINLFLHTLKEPLWQMIAVSGLFKQDKYIAILGSVINLIVSFIAGREWGITGILLGTTSTYIIQIILKVRLLFTDGFKSSQREFLWQWVRYIIFFGIEMYFTKYLTSGVVFQNMLLTFILQGLICILFITFFTVIACYNFLEFQYCISLVYRFRNMILNYKRR